MNEPLVSVLMTSYNRDKYIATAIESVLKSSFTDFELIIVDDCSKDKTYDIAKNYAKADSRVRVYRNEKNLGDYPNRNAAAEYAKGKYLKYVDSDDLIYPWGLEWLVNIMEEFPDAGWGLCSINQDDFKIFPFQLSPREIYLYNYNVYGLFQKAPLSSIIKRDVFINEGGFSNIRMAGDFEMWHRLACKYPLVLMPQGMVWYRKHEEQEMSIHQRFFYDYEFIRLKYLTNDLCPLLEEEKSKYVNREKAKLKKLFVRSLLKLRFKKCQEVNKLLLEVN